MKRAWGVDVLGLPTATTNEKPIVERSRQEKAIFEAMFPAVGKNRWTEMIPTVTSCTSPQMSFDSC